MRASAQVNEVIVQNVDIELGQMVWLLVKLVVAALPALLVLSIVCTILVVVFGIGSSTISSLLRHAK